MCRTDHSTPLEAGETQALERDSGTGSEEPHRQRQRAAAASATEQLLLHEDLCGGGSATQELQDGFFPVYSLSSARGDRHSTDAQEVLGLLKTEDEEDEEEDDEVGYSTIENGFAGRSEGHHGIMSQYVPDAGVEEDIDSPDDRQEVVADTPEPAKILVGSLLGSKKENMRAQVERSCQPTCYWPHPTPPPASALPAPGQSRVAFHTQRYGMFIRAYLGLSPREVEQAQRRGRRICMIGVRKVASSGSRSREAVRVQRSFLRHSVLAVEGDAVFSELIDRAEVLYALDQERLATAVAEAHKETRGSPSVKMEDMGLFYRQRKLPRVAEPHLQPNARCIALHYGLPLGNSADTSVPPSTFPRATLMAVVCTNQLEDNAEIYVSMESYYRCLDEVAWYRRCYSAANTRSAASAADVDATPDAAELQGDIYTGVKQFSAWPSNLSYYHGVGRRHASPIPQAAFPFTLVGLGPAPELGEGEKGVVASAWLPYGTCLLYTGPSVSTRRVEKLVTERLLGPSDASKAVPDDAVDEEGKGEEDLSFVADDTYALGLGRHGVCFGQGLTRYINHRYNLARFGNVELCSVMLSVPSEFAAAATADVAAEPTSPKDAAPPVQEGCSASTVPDQSLRGRRRGRRASRLLRKTDSALTEQRANEAVTEAMTKPSLPSTTSDAGVSPPGEATAEFPGGKAGVAPSTAARQQRRRQRRRTPCLYPEEKSYFVTVPFFMTTTDIAPGTPLLAWTYGEDYDAKLERHVVSGGSVVPYIDAVLLNRRCGAASAPGFSPSVQRYRGDYRFAVGVGDVVWRRRPYSIDGGALLPGSAAGAVPPPENDLFVVVQTPRHGVERVLLRPLHREVLTDAELKRILQEQHLDTYISPHHSRESGSSLSKRPSHLSCVHWAVFGLPEELSTPNMSSSPTSVVATSAIGGGGGVRRRNMKLLQDCLIATTETVGLLLVDVDYCLIYQHPASKGGKGPTLSASSPPGGGAHGRRIVVNLNDLRHATSLVRDSAERAAAVPPMCCGLLWPLFMSSAK